MIATFNRQLLIMLLSLMLSHISAQVALSATSAADASSPDQTAPAPAEEKPQELQFMESLSQSVPKTHTVHWVEETDSKGHSQKVLILESMNNARSIKGNIMIMARPGFYPYQTPWFEPFIDHLNQAGWNTYAVGLHSAPTPNFTLPRHLETTQTIEDIQNEQQVNYQNLFDTWLSQAQKRTELLTNLSASKPNDRQILIAEGTSGYVIGVMANRLSGQLSGLVLINLSSPTHDGWEKLEETLPRQGPILEVIFSLDEKIQHEARHRMNLAKQAGNPAYRVTYAPTGMPLSASSVPWLTRLIHGWALSQPTQEKKVTP